MKTICIAFVVFVAALYASVLVVSERNYSRKDKAIFYIGVYHARLLILHDPSSSTNRARPFADECWSNYLKDE